MIRWWFVSFVLLCLLVPSAFAQEAIPLEYGVIVEGELNDGQPSVSYAFDGTSGDEIFVSAFNYNSGIDIVLRIFSPGGALLKETSGYLSTIIQPFELATDGRYTIVVERPSWSTQSGDFAVIVGQPQERSFDGAVINGTFSMPGELLMASFQGEAGQIIDYSVLGRAMGLYIYDPDGNEFIRDGYYDDLVSYNLYQLPTTGEYRVILQTLADGGSDYTMKVRKITGEPLAVGQTSEGVMLESERPIFYFDSMAGQAWSIVATLPSDGDRQIQVFKLEGREYYNSFVASAYTGGVDGNPLLDPFIAPENGRYYVMLVYNNYEPSDARAPYSLSLQPSEVTSMETGQIYEGRVTPERGFASFIYDGEPNETIRVTLELSGDLGSLGLEVTTASGYVFSYGGSGTISRFSFDIQLTEDVPYLFTVRDNSYSAFEMPFTIVIEALD